MRRESKRRRIKSEYEEMSKSENINEYEKLRSVVGEGGRVKRRGRR